MCVRVCVRVHYPPPSILRGGGEVIFRVDNGGREVTAFKTDVHLTEVQVPFVFWRKVFFVTFSVRDPTHFSFNFWKRVKFLRYHDIIQIVSNAFYLFQEFPQTNISSNMVPARKSPESKLPRCCKQVKLSHLISADVLSPLHRTGHLLKWIFLQCKLGRHRIATD